MTTLTIGKDPVQITLSGHTMGSDYAVKYINWADGTPQPTPETLKAAIDDRLQQVNDEMSTYIPNSHISRINQLRDTESHTPLPRDFAHVFQAALRINRITQGGLDVTLGALVNAWGFGPEPRGALPDAEETARRAAAVGMDKFELQQQGDATLLRKKHPDLYLDLSSIAKGFGVDAVAQVLEDAGIPDYLVEIGGEIRSAGKSPTGEPWRIAIEQPRAAAPSASNHRPAASRLGNIGRLPQFPPRRKRQHAHAFNQPPHAATRAQQHRLAVGNCPHQHGGRRLGNGPDHIGRGRRIGFGAARAFGRLHH